MISKIRRISCLCLTAVMAASLAAGNAIALAQNNTSTGLVASDRYDTVSFEDVTGKLDLTGIALQNLSPAVIENALGYSTSSTAGVKTVIVTLNEDSLLDTISEDENVSDYLSTYSGYKALKKVQDSQENLFNQLSELKIPYTLEYTYSAVTNAVAIEVDTAYLSAIKSLPNVKSVVVSQTYAYPESAESEIGTATTNPSNVYATGIYDSSSFLGISSGEGVTVAILDTGLDYTHNAFTKYMPPEDTLSMTKEYVADKLATEQFKAESLSAAKGKNITVDDLFVSNKVPFAYDYADKDADVYPSYSQHGTHVAGIVAGHDDSYTNKDGQTAVDDNGQEVSFYGVAPDAQLVICKVFTDDFDSKDLGGATSEDIIAALEDCVLLGVDIINMSLGTVSGFSSVEIGGDDEGAALNEIYGRIKEQGISLICAASNDYSSGFGSAFGTNLASNPDSGTVGSPSTFVGAMSVASINGQLSPFMVANATDSYVGDSIFYTDASDENYVKYDFAEQLLYNAETDTWKQSDTFKYVVIPGIGQASDYTSSVKAMLNDKSEGKTIAVVKRGTSSFKDKVEIAQRMGADAVIIYNNVAGGLSMSLGDLKDPIPTVSVSMDAGALLTRDRSGNTISSGYIEVNRSYQAGPFMNDYSSWGSTPDLKLKPDVTSHGGEITSTVSGGYAEMSGTSMASPNLAGFVALVRGYIKNLPQFSDYSSTQITQLVNQLVMSTATTVYDQEGLPYSPRKQGAGLATLDNVFSTQAYLWTDENNGGAEDNRPKIELGDDAEKKGVYTFKFSVTNFGNTSLAFKTDYMFFTETLASDGLAVAEKARLLTDIPAVWKVNNLSLASGTVFTVAAGESATIQVTLTLSDAEKAYLDASFVNGMYVEGFIKLLSQTDGQCDLTLPFMGFYGDWESAPLLDYDAFQIAAFQQDTSLSLEEKPQPSVWATQAFSSYYNEKYTIPMGSYLYLQDEAAEQVYASAEHSAVSCFNEFYSDYGTESFQNYMTSTSIKALYAGLLRNVELVNYDLFNAETGELVKQDSIYRVGKAYANGGSSVPAQVLLELDPVELGLVANGKYQIDFHFYFKADDVDDPEKQDNTFSMVFYVDYEAPILEDVRIRYYDYKDGTKDAQKVYLDIDVYDNVYAQSVLLCYSETDTVTDITELKMATEYITPIYNSVKNGSNTVSIEITDIYDKLQNRLYVQVDDYALNHKVYQIIFSSANSSSLPASFDIVNGTEITIGVNETHKVQLSYSGTANLSNFTWTAVPQKVAQVKNGEIFGAAVGDATVTVTGADGISKQITVHVVESNTTLSVPALSFGLISTSSDYITKATGTVKVNAGETFTLEVQSGVWYYPVSSLQFVWSSSNETIATVSQSGEVTTLNEEGIATITATPVIDGKPMAMYAAIVTLSVQDPFTVSSFTLTRYKGSAEVVVIPDDEYIMTIGEEAFKDNNTARVIIIPKTVTQIDARAFLNCTALEEVYFIQQEAMEIPDADLALILGNAFEGCTNLRKVDFSNVKTITLGKGVFYNCTALEEVVNMKTIGTMFDQAFAGCTSLTVADISGLHTSGAGVFMGCTSLDTVYTDYFTALGEDMFYGCTSLESVTINNPSVSAEAFKNCTGLTSVYFGNADSADKSSLSFSIGSMAFFGCSALTDVEFNGYSVSSIGDMAFANCTSLAAFTLPNGLTSLGDRVFYNTSVNISISGDYTTYGGAVYKGTALVLAPDKITSSFEILSGTTEISAYAFSGCTFDTGVTLTLPDSIKVIGEGAFAYSGLTNVNIPADVKVIAAYTFCGTPLTQITINSSITEIGEGAFSDCTKLVTVNFAEGSNLKVIGDGAFSGCTKLVEVTLPDGAATMGSFVFSGCTSLVNVILPSVTSLGSDTFYNTPVLATVVFGENAETAGSFTFFALNGRQLTNVTLGNRTYALETGVFYGCNSLASIDLKNVTVIGDYAFSYCDSLATVIGLENVTDIGNYAFAFCDSLTQLNLTSAKVIGVGAFESDNASYTTLDLPVVEQIGSFAFYGGGVKVVTLPSTLTSVGDGAFANSSVMTTINVDENNPVFFSEDGVLYRIITDFRTGLANTYELCAYPTAKYAAYQDGIYVYAVKENTVTIQAYAFSELKSGRISKIILPYSIKTIGDSAFYYSDIQVYQFESIAAPTLLTSVRDTAMTSLDLYSMYYTNFNDELINHISLLSTSVPSTITIRYPSNGTGYDNYIYSQYFGTRVSLGELIDDTTRELITLLSGFVSADTVSGWNTLEVNETNTNDVIAFSEQVKYAHGLLNTISSEVQLGFLQEDEDYVAKLTDIEGALKSVKARFGIPVTVSSLTVSEDSTYKQQYNAGEAFDITGLILIVTYDDYSSEVLTDTSALSVAVPTGSLDDLSVLNRYVSVTWNGKTVQVPITVVEGDGTQSEDNGNNAGTGINPAVIYGPVIAVIVVAAAAVACVLLIKKHKKAVNQSVESDDDLKEANSSESASSDENNVSADDSTDNDELN